ncbi:MAG: MBL fold metallo-hydrolase [Candidatus Eremiobacteraeota bacterium]|nr:MBL fold metallo-hydrolase [Candidatus Eremiobacteraeota bacterium]
MCIDYPISRIDFVKAAAAGALTPATALAEEPAQVAQAASYGPVQIRWLGGGVSELSTVDGKQIVLVDAWIWSNSGFSRFNLTKPPELASGAAYADHVAARKPDAVFVLLTHDHGDHIGDYFELLRLLGERKLNLKTAGQSDLMRVGLIQKFKEAGLDYAQLVVSNGAGVNVGGVATHAGIRATVVPAFHSSLSGAPAVGFVIHLGGKVIYATGDTDVYGDMALVGRRYKPDLMLVCAGNGYATMGPEDAAEAVRLVGPGHAIPVHYGANPLMLGPEAGERFRVAVAKLAPRTRVTVLKPGESTQLT